MPRRLISCLTISFLWISAVDSAESPRLSYAPVYEGAHVLPTLRSPGVPHEIDWGPAFLRDVQVILSRYQWYMAEITCLVDESGQVRDAFVTEALPSKNLSASMVNELRQKRFAPAMGPDGPVPSRYAFGIKYILQGFTGDLGNAGGRLRSAAEKGDADSQYILSRILGASVSLRKSDLDGARLLHGAADGGDPRAMLELGLIFPATQPDADPAATLAGRRQWQLKAALAGSGPAKLLVALDAWAERTDEGYARSRNWLLLAKKQNEAASGKYLAALLVSHSRDVADWKVARTLANEASRDWHDQYDPDTRQILAAAAALTGDFKAAIEAQKDAIALAKKAGWATEPLATRLAAYEGSHTVTDEIVMVPAIARVIVSVASGPSN